MSDECPGCKSQDALGCIEPEIYDGILWWICNDCGCAYVRESKIEYRTHWATKFVNCWNTARDDASETRAALDAAQDDNRTLREQIEAQGETLAATCREANEAIEDAQDEIERKITEIEAVRIERDNRDDALRAVLDLHKPLIGPGGVVGICTGCVEYAPCSTTKTITDALNGVTAAGTDR